MIGTYDPSDFEILVDKGVQGQMVLVESPQATESCGCGESVSFTL